MVAPSPAHDVAEAARVRPVLADGRPARRKRPRRQEGPEEEARGVAEAAVARGLVARVGALEDWQLRVGVHRRQVVVRGGERAEQARPVEEGRRRRELQPRRDELGARARGQRGSRHVQPPQHVIKAAKLLVEGQPMVGQPSRVNERPHAPLDVMRQSQRESERLVAPRDLVLVEKALQQLVQRVVGRPDGL